RFASERAGEGANPDKRYRNRVRHASRRGICTGGGQSSLGRSGLKMRLDLPPVRIFSSTFVRGEIFVDSDQPEGLAAGSLEVEVRVRNLEPPDTESEDRARKLVDVV